MVRLEEAGCKGDEPQQSNFNSFMVRLEATPGSTFGSAGRFQFLYGAIGRSEHRGHQQLFVYFNSFMVRLEGACAQPRCRRGR
jgi:hypothetical protein